MKRAGLRREDEARLVVREGVTNEEGVGGTNGFFYTFAGANKSGIWGME
jgi:hypothetical protein